MRASRNTRASKAKGSMNPLSRNNIGSRTGKDVKAGKNIRRFDDGMENFDDYWTESDDEKTSEINIERSENDPPTVNGCQEANVPYLKQRAIPSMSPFSAASSATRRVSCRSSDDEPHSLASCREASVRESGNLSSASVNLQSKSAFTDQIALTSDSMQATEVASHHTSPTENEDMTEDVSCKYPSVQITSPDDVGCVVQNISTSADNSRLKVSGSSLNVAGDKLGSITKNQVEITVTNDTMLQHFKTKKRLHFSEELDSHVDQSEVKLNTKTCSKRDSTFHVVNSTETDAKAVASDKMHSTRKQKAVDNGALDTVNNSVVASNATKGSNRRQPKSGKNMPPASSGVEPHVEDIYESVVQNVTAETNSHQSISTVSGANKSTIVSRSLSKSQDVGQLVIEETEAFVSSKIQTKNMTYQGQSGSDILDSDTEGNLFLSLEQRRNKSHHNKEPQGLVILEADSSVFTVVPKIADKKNRLQGKKESNNHSRIERKKCKSPMKNISNTYNAGKGSAKRQPKSAKNSPMATSGTQTLISESSDEHHVTANTSTHDHSLTSIASNVNKSIVVTGNQSKSQGMMQSSSCHAETFTSAKQQRKNSAYQGESGPEMSDSDMEGYDNSYPMYDPLRSGVSHRQRRRTSVLKEAPVEISNSGTRKCLEDAFMSPKQTKAKCKKRVTISDFIFMTPNSKDSRKSDVISSILKAPASSAYRSINSSLQHIFEETVSQTPVASQHNLHPKIILPENSPHQNLRRSKRTRVAPLQSYKSERIIYRRQSGMFVIDHIEPAPIDAIMQKKQRIHNLKVLQRKKTVKKSRIPVTPRRLSIHGQIPDEDEGKPGDDFLVINPDTNEELICECVSHRESRQYSNEAGLNPSPADPFIMACSFRHPAFHSGELRLRPFAKKPTQCVQNNTFVFAIIYGKLFVTIHRNQFIVESGDHFFVPRGNTYSVQNLRDDEAKLTYFQMCDV